VRVEVQDLCLGLLLEGEEGGGGRVVPQEVVLEVMLLADVAAFLALDLGGLLLRIGLVSVVTLKKQKKK
jgi:hypothetical protein